MKITSNINKVKPNSSQKSSIKTILLNTITPDLIICKADGTSDIPESALYI